MQLLRQLRFFQPLICPSSARSIPPILNHRLRSVPHTITTAHMSSSNDDAPQTEDSSVYTPPKVWTYENSKGSKFSMNRPTAGARFDKMLSKGTHPIQLYSLATPNGQKITILLEELLQEGKDAEYDAWLINIMESDQFGSDFVDINPNSKIPAMRIYSKDDDKAPPTQLFESGSMMLQLAEQYESALLPTDSKQRADTLNWLFWQMGSAPYLGGGFGHFFAYADVKQKYPIDRFTMEAKRQLDVLERNLKDKKYVVGDTYTIADIAIWPWYGQVVLGKLYKDSDVFLNVKEDYPNVIRWATDIGNRPAVQRGALVNSQKMAERHSAADFDAVLEEQAKL